MSTQFHKAAALFYGMAVLSACASQARRDFTPSPSGSLGVITEGEVAAAHGTTAYEVVERARPMYLMSKVDVSPSLEREVFLNGVRLGGVNELRSIPAGEIREIRFVRAIDVFAYGVGRSGAAILVTSKTGR